MAVPKKVTLPSPLTQAHKEQIDSALKLLSQLEGQITKAKLAGLDTAEYEARKTDLETRLRKIKQAYFPQG